MPASLAFRNVSFEFRNSIAEFRVPQGQLRFAQCQLRFPQCQLRCLQFDCRLSIVDIRSAPQWLRHPTPTRIHHRALFQRANLRRRLLRRAVVLPLPALIPRPTVAVPAIPAPRRPPNLAVLEAKLKDLRLFEALLRRDVVATLDISK